MTESATTQAFIDALLAFGFKEFPIHQQLDRHDRHWQFCKRDEVGKRFFVQVRLWRFSKYSNAERVVDDSWDAQCQFDMCGERTFDVTTHFQIPSPQEIVDWFNNVWERMGCTYYEK